MRFLIILVFGMLSLTGLPAQKNGITAPEEVHTKVFGAGDFNSVAWRIPAIAQTKETLVAVADARRNGNGDLPNDIDLVARTSTDYGKTWSDPIVVADFGTDGASDPALGYDPVKNELVCLFASHRGLFQSTPDDRIRMQVCRSSDGGRSWSVPVDVSDQVYQAGWYAAWVASGTIHRMPSGRMIAAIGVRETAASTISNYIIYSDDRGVSWKTAPGRACIGGDEAKMMSLRDGRLMMLVRHKGSRLASWSSDEGHSWSEPVAVPELIEPAVNGDLIRYCPHENENDGCFGPILFSIASHPTQRKNLTVFSSADEGKSWQPERVIHPGLSAYSAMTVLQDGSVGVFYENGDQHLYDLYFTRFFLASKK